MALLNSFQIPAKINLSSVYITIVIPFHCDQQYRTLISAFKRPPLISSSPVQQSLPLMRRRLCHEPAKSQTTQENAGENRHEVSHVHRHDGYHAVGLG